MRAQNFDFAPKLPKIGILGPNFAFLDHSFSTRKRLFYYFRQQKNFREAIASLPPPTYTLTTPRSTASVDPVTPTFYGNVLLTVSLPSLIGCVPIDFS